MRTLILFCILSLSIAAQADVTTDIIRCTKIKNNDDRLDCFDTVATYYKQHGAAKAQSTQSTATVSEQAAIDSDTITLSKEDSFGKSAAELTDVDSIKSTIVGEFKGWKKGAIIELANGQKWKVTSSSTGYVTLQDPEVEVSRGFWGSFNMKVEGLNAKAKVKRIH